MRSRILDIYARYNEYIHRLVPLQVEDEYLKIVIYFTDGSNLRVTEEWRDGVLIKYVRLANFPHHKHVGRQSNIQPSGETCLEEVMQVIIPQLSPPDVR